MFLPLANNMTGQYVVKNLLLLLLYKYIKRRLNIMSTYRVFGRGETHFFDPDSYRDIVTYITNPQKAAFTGGCNVTSIETAAAEMQQVAKGFGKDCGKRVRHSELSFSECETVTPEMANVSLSTMHRNIKSFMQFIPIRIICTFTLR